MLENVDSLEAAAKQDASDWDLVMRLLPDGWREKARELGAMRRARGFADSEQLLRTLLIHLVDGCSLRETSVKARQEGFGNASDVAIFKRLRNAGEWFRWMAAGIMAGWSEAPSNDELWRGRRVRLVDATVVSEPGKTGSDWRLHYSVELSTLSCNHVDVTGQDKGETFRRFPVFPGDVLIADRAYATQPGIVHVVDGGGDVIVRLTLNNLVLETPVGKPFNILAHLRRLRIGEIGEWPCRITKDDGNFIEARVCAIKKSRTSAEQSRRKLLQKASKDQVKSVRPQTIEGAGYVFVLTTIPTESLESWVLLELYRGRWQIEILFKRLKSLLGLGHLPKEDPTSSKAWLHGKILAAFLVEACIRCAESFFPWGYPIRPGKQSLTVARERHDARSA